MRSRPSRLGSRLRVLPRAAWQRAATVGRRAPPAAPARILVAHHLLLGDTLMLTPLLAKLREQYPGAEIVMTTPRAIAPLYQRAPYGVRALPYDPRDARTLARFDAARGYDLALVPGDNRFSWLAAALGARWIVAFGGDRPAHKSWPVDELRPYPDAPAAWGDMVAGLVDGPPPRPYRPEDWGDPEHGPFDVQAGADAVLHTGPYAVLHVGASTLLKQWEREKWRALAENLAARGLAVVWSGGRGEEAEVTAIDPGSLHASVAGKLDLPQMWHLVKRARLLVCPDTGIAHLGRIVNTPTVTLFGPGSAVICGAGDFWRASPYRAVTVDPFPCRDQRVLFKREIAWVRRCGRSTAECPAPRCMHAIGSGAVTAAIDELLEAR
jgi:ADP-heptose:LPS heptosyltransferase